MKFSNAFSKSANFSSVVKVLRGVAASHSVILVWVFVVVVMYSLYTRKQRGCYFITKVSKIFYSSP